MLQISLVEVGETVAVDLVCSVDMEYLPLFSSPGEGKGMSYYLSGAIGLPGVTMLSLHDLTFPAWKIISGITR